MTFKEKILGDLKAAMQARDVLKVATLRLMNGEMKNAEIGLMKKDEGLSDDEVITVLQRMVKQRNDAAQQFEAGGRADLVEKERAEIVIIQAYLPAQISDEELSAIVKETAAALGETDFGKVMGAVMAKVKGKADGARVRLMVESTLKE
ncbi:MAG: GatB/YqeY domain-containing protein [bacterium]|nr:GatB/YqeY domain-containing protein [bacterium]